MPCFRQVSAWDYIMVYFVCRRLDPETHEAWELKLGKSSTPPSYSDLDEFLESRVRAMASVDSRASSSRASTSGPRMSAGVHTALPAAALFLAFNVSLILDTDMSSFLNRERFKIATC